MVYEPCLMELYYPHHISVNVIHTLCAKHVITVLKLAFTLMITPNGKIVLSKCLQKKFTKNLLKRVMNFIVFSVNTPNPPQLQAGRLTSKHLKFTILRIYFMEAIAETVALLSLKSVIKFFKLYRIPTTLPTLDELLGHPKFPLSNLSSHYLSLLTNNAPQYYDHSC